MEFANVGKHCSESTCRQKDFLPFECKFCRRTFCLDHRAPKDHQCTNSEIGAKKAISCPICLKTLPYFYGEDENEIWSKHFNTECQEQISKEKQQTHNKKCFAKACNNKILPLNTFICQKCGYDFCLKHRYEDSHDCKENLLLRREKAYGWQQPKENIEKKVYVASEIAGKSPVKEDINSLEFCEFCGKSFQTVFELINHTETFHLAGAIY